VQGISQQDRYAKEQKRYGEQIFVALSRSLVLSLALSCPLLLSLALSCSVLLSLAFFGVL